MSALTPAESILYQLPKSFRVEFFSLHENSDDIHRNKMNTKNKLTNKLVKTKRKIL